MPATKKKKLEDLSIEALQDRQGELTAARLAILEEARAIQGELDRRAAELEERRVLEAERLGQSTRPAQSLL